MAFNRTFNQNNVDTERSFGVPPVGEYDVKIVEAREKISQSSGKDMIELELEIINSQVKGKFWVYIVDDQYADQRIYEIFSSAGKPVPATITSKSFIGLVGRVKVKHETANGEQRAKVNYWLKAKNPTVAASGNEAPKSTDNIPF